MYSCGGIPHPGCGIPPLEEAGIVRLQFPIDQFPYVIASPVSVPVDSRRTAPLGSTRSHARRRAQCLKLVCIRAR